MVRLMWMCIIYLSFPGIFVLFSWVSHSKFVLAVDILKKQSVDKIPSDLEGMEASMERLLALIDDVYKYVDNVVVRK